MIELNARPPRRARGADRPPPRAGRRAAGGGALVRPRRPLGRPQPARATRCGSGTGDRAAAELRGGRGDRGARRLLAAAAARLRLAAGDGPRGGGRARRPRPSEIADQDGRPALAGAAEGARPRRGPGSPTTPTTGSRPPTRRSRSPTASGDRHLRVGDPRRRRLRLPVRRRLRRLRSGRSTRCSRSSAATARRRRHRDRQPDRLGADGQGDGAARARPNSTRPKSCSSGRCGCADEDDDPETASWIRSNQAPAAGDPRRDSRRRWRSPGATAS